MNCIIANGHMPMQLFREVPSCRNNSYKAAFTAGIGPPLPIMTKLYSEKAILWGLSPGPLQLCFLRHINDL